MLSFNIAQLLHEPIGTKRSYTIEEEIFRIEGLALENLRGEVCLTRLRGEILIQGWAEGKVVLKCSRCLEAYTQSLHVELEIEFASSTPATVDESPPDAGTDSHYLIDEYHILDLSEPTREAFILNSPMQPLCRLDCAGLCPICGENLNTGSCPGHAKEMDERLAILASLLSTDTLE